MLEPIFSVSGLRGIVGKNLSPEIIRQVITVFIGFLGKGRYVIGRDTRPSGREMDFIVSSTLQELGCEVIELGICPTPTVVHFVRNEGGVRGGVVITASHNPLAWNGLKLVHPEGRFLFAEEVAQLQKELRGFKPGVSVVHNQKGGIGCFIENEAVARHITAIRKNGLFAGVNCSGLRVGVDAVNGAMSQAGCELVRAFGAEPVPIFCEPEPLQTEFPRGPEPTPSNLTQLSQLVRQEKLDLGFAFDPDGDRFSCVDEQGKALGEEATICLAGLYILPRLRGDVVVNLSTSRAIEDIAARFGVRVHRTKVGEANVVRKLLETGAALGGEGNGGVILPAINLTRDGLVAAATVLGLLSAGKRSLAELRQELPDYYLIKEVVPVPGFDINRLVEQAGVIFSGEVEIDQSDGVRFSGEGWWVHIRQSNTEPVIRLVAESSSRQAAEEIVSKVRAIIKGVN